LNGFFAVVVAIVVNREPKAGSLFLFYEIGGDEPDILGRFICVVD
jgi:hypothetical protein